MKTAVIVKFVFIILLMAGIVAAVLFLRENAAAMTGDGQSLSFFEQFVISGGPIVWFVLLPLSVLTVYLTIDCATSMRRKKLLPDSIAEEISAVSPVLKLNEIGALLEHRDDIVSLALAEAIGKSRGDWIRIRGNLLESMQERASKLQRRTEWLNLIGNVSPMVGLFGTVFGMIKLFNAIVIAGGQPQPAQLAEGISVALVTTFWGLLVAIPALAVYSVLQNHIENIVSDAYTTAEEVMIDLQKSLLQNETQTPRHKPKPPLKIKDVITAGKPKQEKQQTKS